MQILISIAINVFFADQHNLFIEKRSSGTFDYQIVSAVAVS